jgi:hypothetical protein
MVEERRRLEHAEEADTPEAKRQRDSLKVTGNSAAYGSLARFDRRELSEPVDVTVFGPDAQFSWRTETPEDPGPFCEPPVAASITAGARLLLAVLERLVLDAGGAYAATDTDSMMIVSMPKGGPVPCRTRGGDHVDALSFETGASFVERFNMLNPFDPELVDALWKVEHESLRDPLWVYAISAKRYCLFRYDESGEPVLVDWSEHGLGLYLDPTNPKKPQRDDLGRRLWVKEAWEWILRGALGYEVVMPPWAARFALTRFTVSGPHLASWFAGFDQSKPPENACDPDRSVSSRTRTMDP